MLREYYVSNKIEIIDINVTCAEESAMKDKGDTVLSSCYSTSLISSIIQRYY